MPLVRLASFPLARREGPANVAESLPAVVCDSVSDTIILGASNNLANVILRNTDPANTVKVFTQLGDFANGTPILPLESITLENVKNILYGRTIAGTATVTILKSKT